MPDSLPIWNLADLYQGTEDPLIGQMLADLAGQAAQLEFGRAHESPRSQEEVGRVRGAGRRAHPSVVSGQATPSLPGVGRTERSPVRWL